MNINLKIPENFPDKLRQLIIEVNTLIIGFLKYTYGHIDDFQEKLEKITELFQNVEYKKEENIGGGNAQYSARDNSITFFENLNRKYDDLTSEEYFNIYATLIHEYSHAISFFFTKIILPRYEEGIADLFADKVFEYIKTTGIETTLDKDVFAQHQYKDTAYTEAGSIIKTLAIFADSKDKDLLYKYHFGNNLAKPNETDFFKLMIDIVGEEKATILLSIEISLQNKNYLTEKEKIVLKELFSTIENIDNLPSYLIHKNTALNDYIYEGLKTNKIQDKDKISELYPNLPNSFFKDYEILLTRLAFQIENAVVRYGENQEQTNNDINAVINTYFNDIDINKIKNGFKNRGELVNFLFSTLKYSKCFYNFDMELGTIVPLIINYDLINNNLKLEESGDYIDEILQTFGFADKKENIYLELTTMTKHQNETLKTKSKEEIFNEIQKVFAFIIGNIIQFEHQKRKYENSQINETEFINQFLRMFITTSNNKINYPITLLHKLIKTIVRKISKNAPESLNAGIIEQLTPAMQNVANMCNLPFEIDVTSNVFVNSFKESPSILQFFKLFGTKDLKIKMWEHCNEILMQVLMDSLSPLSINELDMIMESIDSEIFKINEKSIQYTRNNNGRDQNELLKSIFANIRINIINRYFNQEKDIISKLSTDPRYVTFLNSYGNNLATEKAKELFIYELKQLEDNEKKETIINKVQEHKGQAAYLFIDDLKALLPHSKPNALEDKENLIRLQSLPTLYWHYYNSLKPKSREEFTCWNCKNCYDNYIKYKDIIPSISDLWKNAFEEQIELLKANTYQTENIFTYCGLVKFITEKIENIDTNWNHDLDTLILSKIPQMIEQSIAALLSKNQMPKVELYNLEELKKDLEKLYEITQANGLEVLITTINNIINGSQELKNERKP